MKHQPYFNLKRILLVVLAVLAFSIQADAMFKWHAKSKSHAQKNATQTESMSVIHANEPYHYSKYQQPRVLSTAYHSSNYAHTGGGPSFGLISIIASGAALLGVLLSSPPIGLVFGAVAIVFGALGLKQRDRNLAIIGLCIGIAAVIIALILL